MQLKLVNTIKVRDHKRPAEQSTLSDRSVTSPSFTHTSSRRPCHLKPFQSAVKNVHFVHPLIEPPLSSTVYDFTHVGVSVVM